MNDAAEHDLDGLSTSLLYRLGDEAPAGSRRRAVCYRLAAEASARWQGAGGGRRRSAAKPKIQDGKLVFSSRATP